MLAVTDPTDKVLSTPVTSRLPTPVTVRVPTPPVEEIPVCGVSTAPLIVGEPMELTVETPVMPVFPSAVTATEPEDPVAETAEVITWTAFATVLTDPTLPEELRPVCGMSAAPVTVDVPKDAVALNPVTEKVTEMDTPA